MSGHDDEVTRLLAAIAEEEPPRALRERALARAAARRPEAADPWRRLWESRPLRLAWAAAVLALVAANVVVRTGSPSHPRNVAPIATSEEHRDSRELHAITELPRIQLGHNGIDVTEGRVAGPRAAEPRTSHQKTEDKS